MTTLMRNTNKNKNSYDGHDFSHVYIVVRQMPLFKTINEKMFK